MMSARTVAIALVTLVFAAVGPSAVALAEAAEPRAKVLVLASDSTEPPEGFLEALSIQLAGSMSVVRAGEVHGTLKERLEAVAAPLREHRGSVGMWVERVGTDGASQDFLVYVVTSRHGRVLVEVVRVPGPESPEAERALALKVREVLDAVMQPGREPDVVERLRRPPARPVRRSPERHRPQKPGPWSAVIEGGVTGSSAGSSAYDPQVGAVLGAGARLRDGSLWGELVLDAAWSSGAHTERGRAKTDTGEGELGLSLRVLHASEALGAGFDVGMGARAVRAEGMAPDGRTGSSTRLVPIARAGPDVRVGLSRAVGLRAAAALDYLLVRQTFSVAGETTTDVGRARGSGWVGLVAILP